MLDQQLPARELVAMPRLAHLVGVHDLPRIVQRRAPPAPRRDSNASPSSRRARSQSTAAASSTSS